MSRRSIYESNALKEAIYTEVEAGLERVQEIAKSIDVNYAAVRFHMNRLCDEDRLVKVKAQGLCMTRYVLPEKKTNMVMVCRYLQADGPRSFYCGSGWIGIKRNAQIMTKEKAKRIRKKGMRKYPMYKYEVIDE